MCCLQYHSQSLPVTSVLTCFLSSHSIRLLAQQSCDPWAFFQAPSTPPTSDPSKWEEQQQLSPTLPIHSQVYTNSSSLGSGGNVLPSYEHRYSAGPTSQEDSMLCDDCDRYIPLTQWESHKVQSCYLRTLTVYASSEAIAVWWLECRQLLVLLCSAVV